MTHNPTDPGLATPAGLTLLSKPCGRNVKPTLAADLDTEVTLTALSKSGDMYTWTGGEHIGVYEQSRPWQAGDEPDLTIHVPGEHQFIPDTFRHLLTGQTLMWEPCDDSAIAHERAVSRQRVDQAAHTAVYTLGYGADGRYELLLSQRGDNRRNKVKEFGIFPTRMHALNIAQHWETTGHLPADDD